MKIGILTFHRANNFGAFLQAFALKSYLEHLGHQVSFVDYWPEEHRRHCSVFDPKAVRSLKLFFRECLLACCKLPRAAVMNRLRKKHFGLDSRPAFQHHENLKTAEFDCIVYGSDQIWWKSTLEGMDGYDPAYWGDFLSESVRKVAYAPSMGELHCLPEDMAFMRDHLSDFHAISAREDKLAEVVSQATGREVQTVLDPTLLIGGEFWQPFANKKASHDYILYYKLMYDDAADAFVNELSARTGMPVKTVLGGVQSYKTIVWSTLFYSPFDLISSIRNASLVVSTSFHGVAFSLLFNKDFYAMGMGSKSGRVGSLLHALELEDRLLENPSADMEIASIDYSSVNRKLEKLREASSSFLSDALKAN